MAKSMKPLVILAELVVLDIVLGVFIEVKIKIYNFIFIVTAKLCI